MNIAHAGFQTHRLDRLATCRFNHNPGVKRLSNNSRGSNPGPRGHRGIILRNPHKTKYVSTADFIIHAHHGQSVICFNHKLRWKAAVDPDIRKRQRRGVTGCQPWVLPHPRKRAGEPSATPMRLLTS